MSRRDDTISIIADDTEGSVEVTVFSATFNKAVRPHIEIASSTVSSATVMFFPYRASMRKDMKGVIAEATDLIIFPWTSTVSTTHRVRKVTALAAYYEVLEVGVFEDHKEVYAKKVENR